MRQLVRNQGALLFQANASLVYGDIAAFKRSTFSIAAWVRHHNIGAGLNTNYFTAGTTHYYWGGLDVSGALHQPARLRFRATNAAAGAITADTTAAQGRQAADRWSFMACTVEVVGSDVTIKHYLDAALIATLTYAAGWSGTYGSAFATSAGTSGVFAISDLMFSGNVLDQPTLEQIMFGRLAYANVPGIISHWPMTEGAGTSAADVIGGYNGAFGATVPSWYPNAPFKSRQTA